MSECFSWTEQIKNKCCDGCGVVDGHHHRSDVCDRRPALVLSEIVPTISDTVVNNKKPIISLQPSKDVTKKEEKTKLVQENKNLTSTCLGESPKSSTKFDQMMSRIEHSFNGVRNLLSSKPPERSEMNSSTLAKTTTLPTTTTTTVVTTNSEIMSADKKVHTDSSAFISPSSMSSFLADKTKVNSSSQSSPMPVSALRKRTTAANDAPKPVKRVIFADGVRPGDANIVESPRQSGVYHRSRHSLTKSLPVAKQPRLTFVPLLGYGGFSLSGQYGSAALNRCPAMKAMTNGNVNRIQATAKNSTNQPNVKAKQQSVLPMKSEKLHNKSQLNILDHPNHHFNWIPYSVDEETHLLCASRVNQTFILGWLIKNV